MPTASDVELAIYDLEGRRVRTLFNGIGEPGAHSLNWDGRDAAGRTVAVGPYFVRLTRSGTVISRAVVLLR